MNIGIFVTSLNPRAASQARFQSSLFEGLDRIGSPKYNFIIFNNEAPPNSTHLKSFSCQKIVRERGWLRTLNFIKSTSGKFLLFLLNRLGQSGSRLGGTFRGWTIVEPGYYRQLRDLNVRLLWNLNQHELITPLPFIRTIWDINHRIHPMYPEYSYTRFGFNGLDENMARSLARASYVIVGTEEGKRQVMNIFGVQHSKVRVIPFPTPELPKTGEHSKRTLEAIAKGPFLFYPARFWPHKNHVVILAALRILRSQRNIRLRCIFSGADEGNLRYILGYAEKLGVLDQIEYLGVISDWDMSAVYQHAHALAYPSAVGPDNLPPLEAMSIGCPVITSDVPGAREQYGDAALYFNPTSESELAQHIWELFENSRVRDDLIDKGRKRAAKWTLSDHAQEMISLFDDFARTARAWERCDSTFT